MRRFLKEILEKNSAKKFLIRRSLTYYIINVQFFFLDYIKFRLEYLLKLHDRSTNNVPMPGIEPRPWR